MSITENLGLLLCFFFLAVVVGFGAGFLIFGISDMAKLVRKCGEGQ